MNEIIEKINDIYKEILIFDSNIDFKTEWENLYYMAREYKEDMGVEN